MTILEAVERAKRLQQEKARQGAPRDHAAVEATGTNRKQPLEATPRALPPLDFEQLPVDTSVHEKNRVLMAGGEGAHYSAVLDSYRMLRTRLWHRGVGNRRWISLGVVSAAPGEGKTLTSINLALAFARDRRTNVFLLDLDLRNPSMCKYLGVQPRYGIGSALNGEIKPHEVFFRIGVDNLVLAGGTRAYNGSSEMLGGEGLNELLAYINGIDPQALILVDLPPLLVSADSLVVAPKLSAMLLVVAEGVTRRDKLDQAVEALSNVTLAGIILNRSQESVEDYYS
jgi:protein-tyrosine kinase